MNQTYGSQVLVNRHQFLPTESLTPCTQPEVTFPSAAHRLHSDGGQRKSLHS